MLVRPGHTGPFKLARMSTNEAARYGTFKVEDASEEGDTTNADPMMTHEGHHVDVLRTPTTGEMMFEKV